MTCLVPSWRITGVQRSISIHSRYHPQFSPSHITHAHGEGTGGTNSIAMPRITIRFIALQLLYVNLEMYIQGKIKLT